MKTQINQDIDQIEFVTVVAQWSQFNASEDNLEDFKFDKLRSTVKIRLAKN